MASTSVLIKLLLLVALVATSTTAQLPPIGAPTVSPSATPTPVTVAPPTQSPAPSSHAPTPGPAVSPAAGVISPSPAPGAASPTAASPAAPTSGPASDQTPADGSNHGFVSRAAIGGTAITAALVAVALM